jgi:ATP-binding cassette subfamily F protein uup
MNILAIEELSKHFGINPLFDRVSFGMDETDKIGVIGTNGSGKSTMLRVIAGLEPADSGKIMTANGKVITYLPQNPPIVETDTVLQTVLAASSDTMKMLYEYEVACQAIATDEGHHDEALHAKVAKLADKLEAAGAWQLETNAQVVLSKLGITDTTAKMGTLSGGQRKRVALAHALVVPCDLLILDEPTNHLDADSVAWLETYLARFNGALLLVTHDRYFLDRVVTRIIELDRGTLQTFSGNYGYYLEKKDEQEQQRETEGKKRNALIRQELAWLRKGAKARTTKQKARIERAEDLMAEPKEAAKAELDISLVTTRLGNKSIEFENVSKSYDGKLLFKDFTYKLKKGDRIGIIGSNGSGKTTLVDMIVGRVKPDTGTVEIGETVVLGYYDQESRNLNNDQRVIDYIREISDSVKLTDGSVVTASQMLERFLFPPAVQHSVIGKLSGGERRRLYLLRILMQAPNVLILDEPTNDLDIPTLAVLEDYLQSFKGCLIVVSHDRYFLDRTIEHLFRFESGKLRNYPGNYSVFLERQAAELAESQANAKVEKSNVKVQQQTERKLSYKERQELQTVEAAIAAAEARKAAIETELAENPSYERVQALCSELETLNAQLDKQMTRWATLAELA